MRTALTLIVVVALALTLAVPTGAVPFGGSGSSGGATTASVDAPGGGVELVPLHQEFTSIQNGELEIQIDRLNDRATTDIEELFAINAGDHETTVRIDENDAIAFYADGDRDKRLDGDEGVSLSPDESVTVGVELDATEDENGTSLSDELTATTSLSITADVDTPAADPGDDDGGTAAPNLVASNLTVANDRLTANESTEISATLTNDGDASTRQPVALLVDGVAVDHRTVDLAPGESETVTFERTFPIAGEYEVGIGDETATIVVEEPAADDPEEPEPIFEVRNVTVDPTEVEPGEPVSVAATVANDGDANGTITAELAVGDVVVDTETVTVPATESRTVSFEHVFDEPGTYPIAVSGTDGDSVTVSDPGPSPVADRDLTGPGTAFAAGPAIGGFIVFVFFRRQLPAALRGWLRIRRL